MAKPIPHTTASSKRGRSPRYSLVNHSKSVGVRQDSRARPQETIGRRPARKHALMQDDGVTRRKTLTALEPSAPQYPSRWRIGARYLAGQDFQLHIAASVQSAIPWLHHWSRSAIKTRRQLARAQPEQTESACSSAHRATTFSWEPSGEYREERHQEATIGFLFFGQRIWQCRKKPDKLPRRTQGSAIREEAGGFSGPLRPVGAPPQFLAEA